MPESIRIPSPDDPAEALAAVVALRRLAAALERDAVDSALAAHWTWAEIGQALGMTAQAAHKRLAPARRTAR
ncbi:RNA polymerase subunit sigma-70 [Microcella humidisoli]|jgi:hypothetical protein|uniref:RNA polymerase subunit sigma-70 n=1 Tax=Microcella humidisoli TaxID=2963406 RepID=A0ABY5FU92_9MICO|nr:RNA polymerase subunit sigma-70 [Microcella humidisoli]UTT61813.1 RNA polymerase subunit sigma-70 [Microcella humidisoli]